MSTLRIKEFTNSDGSILPLIYSPGFPEETAGTGSRDKKAPTVESAYTIRHFFTTRHGGVSIGPYATMNLGFGRGDGEENVRENFRRLSAAVGLPVNRFVLSQQTHTDNIRIVTEADAGKGVTVPRDYTDVDALVTAEKDIALVIYIADCVPILFADPVRRVIAAAHSGWRGTAAEIAAKTLDVMKTNFGTDPADVYTVIGPCICQDCYEVGPEVAEAFKNDPAILKRGRDDRFQLDLREANRRILLKAGCREEKMTVTDICTCCSKDFLFSHRGNGPVRGNLAAVIAMKART